MSKFRPNFKSIRFISPKLDVNGKILVKYPYLSTRDDHENHFGLYIVYIKSIFGDKVKQIAAFINWMGWRDTSALETTSWPKSRPNYN